MNPGTRLDHYEILDKIGEGGMGAVYRARDTTLDRDVAVKVLPPSFAADAGRVARFEREAKVVAALSHPNIVAMYGFGTVEGVTYAAMELLEGRSLREHLDDGALPLRKAVDIARQIASGLDAAHVRGVVHRDLKPDNVFITPDGRARILDFGLAAAGEASGGDTGDSGTRTRLTDPGTVVGTAGYMSPEQARGAETDAATDIFALGVMLQEMLSGEHPFHRETTAETLTAILREEPPELRVAGKSAPPGLARIVRRCLEKAPGERFRNAVDLAFALESAVADSGASQPAMTAVEAGSQPGARGPLPLVAALLLAAMTFAAGWWLRPAPPLAGPPVVRELTFTGEDTQPDASPDGRLIAFTSQRNGISQIWLRQVDGGGEQPLTEGPDWRPSFSPDSQSVAFIRADGDRYSAFRVPVVGGQPRKLIENVMEVAWSPDERQLAFVRGSAGTREETAVGVLDAATGRERILATPGEWTLFGLRWSADSQRLAVVKASAQGGAGNWKLMIIDVANETVDEIDVGTNSLISNPNWSGDDALIFARSETTVTGTPRPSAIVRYDLGTGEAQPLFWEPYLFPLRGSFTETTRMSLLGDDRIVFDTLRQVESLWELDQAAGTLRPIRQGVSVDRQPAYSPDGSRLLFTSNRSGNVDLFAYEFATDRLLQITDHPASDWDGAYTPDGRSVLFSSDRSGNLEIWMADADGSNPRQVTNTGVNAENPTMTADGEWIVYSSGDPAAPGIYKIHPDGTEPTLLASGALTNPEVSHDGRYVVFVAGEETTQSSQVRAVDVATGAATAFVSETAWEPGSANVTYNRSRWMAGDTAVAFLGTDEGGRPVIRVQDFDPDLDTTATLRKLTDMEVPGVTESFGISSDGNRAVIAVVRNLNILKMAEGLGPLR